MQTLHDQLTKQGNGILCPFALIVRNGAVLTGHRHYTPNEWKRISVWTLPGGRSDAGETIEEALRRETAEEVNITGLEIVGFVGEVPGAKGGDVIQIFYCTTEQDAQLMEPEKFSEWRWVPVGDFIADEAYVGFNPMGRKVIVEYLSKMR
jgi:ADP-ribose pyrophosphatase YjhB (NUDIX family)